MSFALRIVFVALSLGTPLNMANGQTATRVDRAEAERIQTNLLEAMRSLEAHYSRVRGHGRLLQRQQSASTGQAAEIKTDQREATFAADHGSTKVTIRRQGNKESSDATDEVVYCIGARTDFFPEYAFTVLRQAGQDHYALRGMAEQGQDFNHFVNYFGRYLTAPFAVNGTPLSYIMDRDPTYRLESVSTETVDGRSLHRITFQRGQKEHPNSTWVLVDPEAGWCVSKGEHRTTTTVASTNVEIVTSFEVEYGPMREGVPIPHRVHIHEPFAGRDSTFEFDQIEFEPTPEKEFTLAHYGMPDIMDRGRPAPRNLSIPIILAVVISAFSAAIALRIRQKRAASTGP